MYPTLEELEKKSLEREERKRKLREALIADLTIPPENYEIAKNKPIKSKRLDVARQIICRLEKGDSILVNTVRMANNLQWAAREQKRFATYKKEGDLYRVWLF